ncbi:O-methyltransferas-like protein family 3 [Rhizodiscina lignyota]|uniref:O-methyltransferas-like protein family 3 n=1 Tax=Rhizodiscina lignyota TaxID=1504668 RepID=A0A9P4M2Q5_9PEZI|nr:O-methyltransferas-like protein family 3 [Rhizodiscina lignyota]
MSTGYSGFKHPGYEEDNRWTAVDNYTSKHLNTASKLNEALNNALKNSDAHGLPPISVSEHQGKFLMLQARMSGAKHILEVGLLGGYSTIWLANSNPDVKVTTVEVSEDNAAVAKENLKAAGVADRVEVVVGSGVEVLPRLVEEVKAGKRPPFGFFFIDADKQNNWTYVDNACEMALPKACIYVDNVVRKGNLAEESATDERILGNRKMVENVGKDSRLDATVIQTVSDKNYDGFLFAVVKG